MFRDYINYHTLKIDYKELFDDWMIEKGFEPRKVYPYLSEEDREVYREYVSNYLPVSVVYEYKSKKEPKAEMSSEEKEIYDEILRVSEKQEKRKKPNIKKPNRKKIDKIAQRWKEQGYVYHWYSGKVDMRNL